MVYADVAIDVARLELGDGRHGRWTCSVCGIVVILRLVASSYSNLEGSCLRGG